MNTVAGSPMTRERLATLAQIAEGLGQKLAGPHSAISDVRSAVRDLAVAVASLPQAAGPDSWDPYLYGALQRAVNSALIALSDSENDAMAARRHLRLALEQIRQCFRDQLEDTPVSDSRPVNEVARWLVENLDTSQAEIAELLGTNLRTLQRWISKAGPTAPRAEDEYKVRAVAQLVKHLRHTLSGRGIQAWFRRPKPELGGLAPAQVLDQPDRQPELVTLASRDRSHNAW